MYCVFLTIDFSYSERKWQQREAASRHGVFPIIISPPGVEYELVNMID
jgi:hypothetical protein